MELFETKEKFIELRAQGYSFDKIAKEIKKSKQILIDWSKEYEAEISNLKSIELEALYEKYYLGKAHRLKSFGTILNKIGDELNKRDFSEVPTDKLLDIYTKYNTLIKDEYIEPYFMTTEEIEDEEFLRDGQNLQAFYELPEEERVRRVKEIQEKLINDEEFLLLPE